MLLQLTLQPSLLQICPSRFLPPSNSLYIIIKMLNLKYTISDTRLIGSHWGRFGIEIKQMRNIKLKARPDQEALNLTFMGLCIIMDSFLRAPNVGQTNVERLAK